MEREEPEEVDEIEEEDLLEDEEDTQKDMYLTFHLAGEDYGLPIAFVTEIIGIQRITAVPDMPPFIRGVINLRGKVIPVIDVRARFGIAERAYDQRTCIVVVHFADVLVGLVVDQVSEVMTIAEEDTEPPPAAETGGRADYIAGLGKAGGGVKILLEVEKLLACEQKVEQSCDG